MNEFPILLYDENCTMCTRFKDALKSLPGSKDITYTPIQDKNIFKKYPVLDSLACKESVHLLISKDEFLVGGEVIKYLVETIPGISKVAWLLDNEAGKKALDFFYNSVNKYRKSKWNSCSNCKK